jgi:hypothetical protein
LRAIIAGAPLIAVVRVTGAIRTDIRYPALEPQSWPLVDDQKGTIFDPF